MGLAFRYPRRESATSPSWSYGGFKDFRRRLAREIGVNLDEMEGYGGYGGQPRGERPWTGIDDAIVPLLRHSDCDGEMSPEECATVGPRLRELVTRWYDDYDRQNGLWLADAMDACRRAGVPLEFR